MKQLTTKPVVGVGRFTSPDTMVSQIRRGIMDFIGAARPSIADPFLPKKIEEGRIDEIRECIGCNMCVSSDYTSTNLRCTQNPTMGEEWRRGWHPEIIPPKKSEGSVLVVGAGPAGLEAALSAARRGFEVHLAEASDGARRPGQPREPAAGPVRMGAGARLAGHPARADGQCLDLSRQRARGRTCAGIRRAPRRDRDRLDAGGATASGAIPDLPFRVSMARNVYTPDDLMAGRMPDDGPVIVWDDDHYYMGGVLAELCRAAGLDVTLVTPAAMVSAWTVNTLEALPIAKRIARLGIDVLPYTSVAGFAGGEGAAGQRLDRAKAELAAGALVTVTARLPVDGLYLELEQMRDRWEEAGIASVTRIGDCWAPSTIQQAVYTGHKWARELDEEPEVLTPRELPMIESGECR